VTGIPLGLCQCGCGQATRLAPGTDSRRGWVKGRPLKYLLGHVNYTKAEGKRYREATRDDGSWVYEHVQVVERAIGKRLPPKAEVHHVNGNKRDNRPANLVACQDRAYHCLLEKRTRALRECGHASWLKCKYCGVHGEPGVVESEPGSGDFHFQCRQAVNRKRWVARALAGGRPTPKTRNRPRKGAA
jgi:hypothetical protein